MIKDDLLQAIEDSSYKFIQPDNGIITMHVNQVLRNQIVVMRALCKLIKEEEE